MADMEIYYFTGSGNSLAAARLIAEKTGGKLLSIPAMMDNKSIAVDTDALGMVFPVYHKGTPLILKRFVEKLENLDQRYLFGLCTYGDTPGLAIPHLAKLIQARGGQLAAGFGAHMPYNYLTPSATLKDFFNCFTLREIPTETQQALLAEAQGKIEHVAEFVSARKSGVFEITSDVLTRIADHLSLNESLGKWAWLKIAGVDEGSKLSFLESRQLMDQRFHADENCNGCRICSRICPVSNIEMVGDRPVWRHRCEQCFACLHWCPQEAIQFGDKTSGRKRYHHPDVKLADILRQASKD